MIQKRSALGLMAVTMAALAATPAWSAAPSLTITLNGKPVTSVPVDQLGDLKVTVNAGRPFKSVFAGQWGGIGQAFVLRGKPFEKGTSTPDPTRSEHWAMHELAATARDSGWSAKSTADRSMFDVAKSMRLIDADTSQQVAFTARFMRLSYTGKTIWQNGGWVKETVWETLGTPLGMAVLKLEPPRNASSLPTAEMFAKVAALTEKAQAMAKTLLYPHSDGADLQDSRILKVEVRPDKPITYSWSYLGNKPYVFAQIPANVYLQASAAGQFPGAALKEQFICPMVVSAKQPVGGAWIFNELEVSHSLRQDARTADGRTAEQVTDNHNPAAGLQTDPAASTEDQAMDLIKRMGL